MASASAHFTRTSQVCVFLIGEFLGEGGVSAARPYQVLPSSLALVGTSAWGRKKTDISDARGPAVPRIKGVFCYIAAARPRHIGICHSFGMDESRLASSLLKDKRFVLPDEDGAHCWHAVRVYMRSRMKAPESVCEHWGSLMHSLWDSVAGWQPHRMVSRLFMRQSPFLDQPAVYELLVNEITRKLYHSDGMNPYFTGRYAWEGYADNEEYAAVVVEIA